ncbi:MAG: alpha-amylase family glycosyl hydrolase [Clostridiales bacterium]|nr:alpha-amylase family glycosyl hydrolase [Clostridiales bacterium]
MAWYETAVFYHVYPLGLCGCPHENDGQNQDCFDQLFVWANHMKNMNCTAIYIGPLFQSGSHGYDTTDYYQVDCRLGNNERMKQWVAHCHNMGMRVVVDGVFNHVGRDFFAFRDLKENREQSRYRDWFCNVNFQSNNEYNDGFSYDNWGGYNLLVKLNLRNPEVKEYLFGAVSLWIHEFEIDGIRLDSANVLDWDFMKELRSRCDQMKSEFWLMGEVIHGDYSRYINPSMLDSVTNYELHKGLYSGHNDHNYFEIAHSVRRLNDLCRGMRLYTFSDNHDVPRLASKLNNRVHQPLIAMLVYTLPGIPSIYYGSEYGIEGKQENGDDWLLRPALDLSDFSEQEKDTKSLVSLYKKLGQLKKEYLQLSYGSYQELLLTNRQFGFARILDNRAIITLLNNDDAPAHLEVNCPVATNKIVDLLEKGFTSNLSEGKLRVDLPANEGMILGVFAD